MNVRKDLIYCPYCMAPLTPDENGKRIRCRETAVTDIKMHTLREAEEGGHGIIICPCCGRTPSAYTASAHHLPPGTILRDRYILGGVLGEGGYGITYIGLDLVLQLRVAVKEYFPVEFCTRNSSGNKNVSVMTGLPAKNYKRGMSKYLTEARQLARMDRQRVIVNVRDYFEDNGTAYIVMEYIDGITFTDLVREMGGRIPEEKLFPIVEPLFGALCTLHQYDLIHRDMCPDNLMLEVRDRIADCVQDEEQSGAMPCDPFKACHKTEDLIGKRYGRIRLLDFGSARSSDSLKDTLTITLRHGFAPIEQYQQGGGQGTWTDVYGLSATLYYCLTGVTPPVATNRIIEDSLITPSKMGVPISPFREAALMKGLCVRPHRRYRTVKEFWNALYGDPV